MRWEQFERLWVDVLKATEYRPNIFVWRFDNTLNLFSDVQEVREFVGDDILVPFARALYCYDLFQQVYYKYFSLETGKQQKNIGTRGALALSNRLSPASMSLALLTNKADEWWLASIDDYRAWQIHEPSFREELSRLNYDDLSSIAPEYFPKLGEYQSMKLRDLVRKKHYEIDTLISTLRFKHLHYDCDICHRMDCYCNRGISSLRVSLREIENSDYEVQMFQKIWFNPEPNADTVSVSANLAGFTMINAVSRALGYDWDHVKSVAEVANIRKEVICISDISPRLIIVPKTRGRNYPPTRRLLAQVLSEANSHKTKILHMTHYGFCNGLSDRAAPTAIFRDLMYPHLKTTIERVIFDYDTRAKRQIFNAFEEGVTECEP